jgi:hypothetical protein
VLTAAALACSSTEGGFDDEGEGGHVSSTDSALRGCRGKASSVIPSDDRYVITTFGDSRGDDGIMSCGTYTKTGSWYYAASRQRYGCGARIKIEANGKCVVAKTDDYGPDVCVENAAGRAIIDVSPLVTKHLFGVRSAGWSERRIVTVTEVSRATPLGPCDP